MLTHTKVLGKDLTQGIFGLRRRNEFADAFRCDGHKHLRCLYGVHMCVVSGIIRGRGKGGDREGEVLGKNKAGRKKLEAQKKVRVERI
jgi:hypothetical protein